MPILAKRAQGIFNGQRQRCQNENFDSYKHYGAKGIRVEYSPRDFIGWWISEFKRLGLKHPSVGRIDHSKNYSFDNIEMVEHADNAREMITRTGGNLEKKPVVLVDQLNGDVHAFAQVKYASKFSGVTESLICLRKRVKAEKKNKFHYDVYDLDKFLEGTF
jgi:hypothetical protein